MAKKYLTRNARINKYKLNLENGLDSLNVKL